MVVTGAEARKVTAVKPRPQPQTIVVTGILREQAVAGSVKAVWTQYGPGGVLEARAVMAGKACPMLALDLKQTPMTVRASGDERFPTLCSAQIPAGTKQAALAFHTYAFKSPFPATGTPAQQKAWMVEEYGLSPDANLNDSWTTMTVQSKLEEKTTYTLMPLAVPVADPQRIIVLGDTGCRIKGTALQDCTKEDTWPFARIAAEAAKLKPDLVVHVGDYLYRENACPATVAGCQGTPFGDNWPTWDADFFAPAKPLLAVAPWVIVRGNHEDCQRAGAGFLRLLGPQAFDAKAACAGHLAQYAVPFAALTMVIGDNADAPEQSVVAASVPVYAREIASLANAKAPVWWITHRPIWGLIAGPLNVPIGGNQTLIAAVGNQPIPATVELMLAGHIHTFEAINYAAAVPPQLIAGFGGDMLDPTPENLRGAIFQGASGVKVKDGLSIGGFGFVLMTRQTDGWRLDVYDRRGAIERVCQFHQQRLDCPSPKR
jgi:hypothetical protein